MRKPRFSHFCRSEDAPTRGKIQLVILRADKRRLKRPAYVLLSRSQARIEDGGHVDGERRQEHGRGRCSAREFALDAIGGPVEDLHKDRLGLGVDNPVFGDARLGILAAFGNQVPLPVLLALIDDLHREIGSLGLAARIGDAPRLEKNNVRVAILACP